MSEAVDSQASDSARRGRGSHKPRGGFGKYLRARGRGRGRGRPAEFGKRLVLEGEEEVELDEEEQREAESRYARRQLGTNADRYIEPEPELNSEGEEAVEPEVDLSSFLERQRLSDEAGPVEASPADEEDVDASLAHIGPHAPPATKKGRIQQIEWNDELERMRQEKAAAEATWDLKARFRAKAEQQRGKPVHKSTAREKPSAFVEPPPLPTDPPLPVKSEKEGMQDFLDDLLG